MASYVYNHISYKHISYVYKHTVSDTLYLLPTLHQAGHDVMGVAALDAPEISGKAGAVAGYALNGGNDA